MNYVMQAVGVVQCLLFEVRCAERWMRAGPRASTAQSPGPHGRPSAKARSPFTLAAKSDSSLSASPVRNRPSHVIANAHAAHSDPWPTPPRRGSVWSARSARRHIGLRCVGHRESFLPRTLVVVDPLRLPLAGPHCHGEDLLRAPLPRQERDHHRSLSRALANRSVKRHRPPAREENQKDQRDSKR
jgi:hypothetical protein